MKRKASDYEDTPEAKASKISDQELQHTDSSPRMKRKASEHEDAPQAKALKACGPNLQQKGPLPGSKRKASELEDEPGAKALKGFSPDEEQANSPSEPEHRASQQEDEPGAEGSEAPGQNEEQKDREEKSKEWMKQASELITSLVVLLESRRRTAYSDKNSIEAERQRAQLFSICELANQPGMRNNPFLLDKLGVSWFSAVKRIQYAQIRTGKLEEELRKRLDDVKMAGDVLDNAIVQHAKALLDVPKSDPFPAEAKQQRSAVKAAGEKLRVAKNYCDDLQDEIRWDREGKLQTGFEPLLIAEKVLVDLNVMQPAKTAEEIVQEEHPSIARAAITNGDNSARERRSHERGDHHRSDNVRTKPPRIFNDILRDERRHNFHYAYEAYCGAEKYFDQVREEYHTKLSKFVYEIKNGNVVGAKTDFDRGYFLDRNMANRQLGIAMDNLEFSKKVAQQVGALYLEEITSDFGDITGDGRGYDDPSNRDGRGDRGDRYERHARHDAVWEYRKEIIENWRRDDRQRDITGRSEWEAKELHRGSGAPTVLTVPAVSLSHLALGKNKELIDRWRAHQEELRATAFTPAPADGTAYPSGVDKRYWFQMFCGI